MRSPRFSPAGLLVRLARSGGRDIRVAIDGCAESQIGRRLDAWLVTDDHAELISAIRRRARALGIEPAVAPFVDGSLSIVPHRVIHTSHPTYAYEIRWRGRRIVWAPEFWRMPRCAAGADLLFADASGWSRPIRFRGGVGGHACALEVSTRARAAAVRELVFAHIGRPTIKAIDTGFRPAFGRFGHDGERIVPNDLPAGDAGSLPSAGRRSLGPGDVPRHIR